MDIERNNDASPINILIHFNEFIKKHSQFSRHNTQRPH